MSNLIRTQILLLALLLLLGRAGAAVPALEEQRQRFAELRERIEQGAELDVQAEIAQLRGYVLAPYLEYFYLQKRLTASPPERIATFLGKHRNLPVAGLLRESYLRQLARQERWAEYRVFYQPTADAELRCYHLRASIADKEPDPAWFEEAKSLWLVGRSQPSACDPVFDELYSREAISADQVWERVTLLIQGGNDRLAERFSAHLDPARREWLEYWLRAHRQPQDVLARPGFPLVGPYAVQVISHALQRLGRSDQELAMMFLERYGQEKFLSPRQKAELARHIALHAAYSQDPRALGWLDALPPEVVTDNVRLWTARMALRNQDWPRLLQAIAALPDRERNDPQWTYWRAHALAAIGEREAAQTEFALLAMERSYYGFLAADRLALPYNLKHVPTAVAKDTLAQVAAKPGIVRAREFFALGMMPEARREWAAAVARLNRAQQQQAALLALEMGWYDRAVVTANQAGLNDDLNLRFPTPYREQVEQYSRLSRLDPHITYAIVRKESAYRPDVASPVGALGLMQVMPQTGRQVASRLRVELPAGGLLDVDTNLKLGSAYLRAMLDRYNGNLALAAAAYNAGPHKVADWLNRNAGLPPTVWIEAISYYETREYVKSVLAFAAVFDWQLNGEPGRLSNYLQPFGREITCVTTAEQGSCQSSMM